MMVVMRDHQPCVCVQHYTYLPMAQHSSVALLQQLWHEWEIQCLVMVSFSFQVFLLFCAGSRKRCSSRALNILLWLAYILADSVAMFILGRLTLLLGNDPRHQLVLFWAPFLLFHLGGQETITAFSMEDCALWKRHLLNLTTQLTLAIYVVGKQWRWDKQLVAPMVLVFISGTTKYAERIWALQSAGSWAPGRSPWGYQRYTKETLRPNTSYKKLASIFSSKDSKEKNSECIVEVAMDTLEFRENIEYLMDVTPKMYGRGVWDKGKLEVFNKVVKGFTSSDNGANLAYKLSEIRLSLIYDYLYTKFGSLRGVFQYRLTTLVLTSTALGFFVVDRVDHKGTYSGVDVCISYILLVGAVALEISSILMWLMSSYWPYMTAISYLRGRDQSRASRCAGGMLLSIVNHLRPHPESRVEWSRKLQQYNLFDEYSQKNQHVNWLEQMMERVGIKQAYTAKHVLVSPEVKKVILDKLCEIATTEGSRDKLAFTSFRGEWAWAAAHQGRACSSESGAAQMALRTSDIQGMDIVSSAMLWHVVTEICLEDDETSTVGSKFRTCSQHLSNYVMYLVVQCKLMLDSDGHDRLLLGRAILRACYKRGDDRSKFVRRVRHGEFGTLFPSEADLFGRWHRVFDKLLRPDVIAYRWELIAMVWAEMLCYIARNSGSGFHAKQLSAGGEFLTHVKLLVFFLDTPDVDKSLDEVDV